MMITVLKQHELIWRNIAAIWFGAAVALDIGHLRRKMLLRVFLNVVPAASGLVAGFKAVV